MYARVVLNISSLAQRTSRVTTHRSTTVRKLECNNNDIDFFFVCFFVLECPTVLRTVSSGQAQGQDTVACSNVSSLGAYHVQHVVCNMVRRNGSAVETKLYTFSDSFHWLKPLTDDRREEIGNKNRRWAAAKCHETETWKSRLRPWLEPALHAALVAGMLAKETR